MSTQRKLELPGFAVAALATIAVVLYGVCKYWWLLHEPGLVQEKFANLGNAVGPLGTIATVGALLAALWSVKLQREDLQLQRQEMADSRKELERTAGAQERLATAQLRQVHAQVLLGITSIDIGKAVAKTMMMLANATTVTAPVKEDEFDEALGRLREGRVLLGKLLAELHKDVFGSDLDAPT